MTARESSARLRQSVGEVLPHHPDDVATGSNGNAAAGAGGGGVGIRLPALDQYLDELHGAKPLGSVTAHLAQKLYRGHGPQPMPANLQAYYTGPLTKGLDSCLPDPLPIHVPAEYAHVKSRILSGKKKLPALAASADHTTLTHGIQVYDPAWAAPGGKGGGSQSPTRVVQGSRGDGEGEDGLSPLGMARGRGGGGGGSLAHSSTSNTLGVAWGAGTMSWGRQQSGGGASVLGGGSRASNGGLPLDPIQKYVSDLGKVMDRVKAGQVLMEKIRAATGSGQPPPGMMAVYDATQGRKGARRAPSGVRGGGDDHFVQVYSSVEVPAGVGQQRLAGSGKGQSAGLLTEIMTRQGYARTDMRKVLDQLPHFEGQDDGLVQGLADRVQLFCYPPGSLLYAKGTVCNELLVLLSGYLMLCADDAPPKRLHPGTVLGLQLMTQRQRVPCDVRTDPNFEAHVASISWQQYEAQMGAWAADKVLALTPGLQFSVEARLRSAVSRGTHMYCQPGQPLYTQDEDADAVLLLIKGQVLVTQQAGPEVIQTEGQVVQQLQMTMGETTAVVPTEMPRMPNNRRGSETGLIARARRESLASGAPGRGSQASESGAPSPTGKSAAADGRGSVLGKPGAQLLDRNGSSAGQVQAENSSGTARAASPMGAASSNFTLATGSSQGVLAGQQPKISPEERMAQRVQDVGAWVAAGASGEAPPPEQELSGVEPGPGEEDPELFTPREDAVGLEEEGVQGVVVAPLDNEEQQQQQQQPDEEEEQPEGEVQAPEVEQQQPEADEPLPAMDEQAAHRDEGQPPAEGGEQPPDGDTQQEEAGEPAQPSQQSEGGIHLPDTESRSVSPSITAYDMEVQASGDLTVHQMPPELMEGPEAGAVVGLDQDGGGGGGGRQRWPPAPVDTQRAAARNTPSPEAGTPIAGLVRSRSQLAAGGTSRGEHSMSAERSSDGPRLMTTDSVQDVGLPSETQPSFAFASGAHGGAPGTPATPAAVFQRPQQPLETSGEAAGEEGPQGPTDVGGEEEHSLLIAVAEPVSGVDNGIMPDPLTGGPGTTSGGGSEGRTAGGTGASTPHDGFGNRPLSTGSAATSDQYTNNTSPSPVSDLGRHSPGAADQSALDAQGSMVSLATGAGPNSARGLAGESSGVDQTGPGAEPSLAGGGSNSAGGQDAEQQQEGPASQLVGKQGQGRPEAAATQQRITNPKYRQITGKSNSKALQTKQAKEGGEEGPVVPLPVLKGMPLYNGLAMAIKANRQQVLAVHSRPVFLGEEGLVAGGDKPKRRSTVLATQPVEYISIPRSALVNLLPSSTLDGVHKRMASQQAHAALHSTAKQSIKRWPEAADQLREYLSTAPGSRPMWQVEALADGFTSIHAVAALPWQARVRVFQDLHLKMLPPGSPGMPLGRTLITVSGVVADAEAEPEETVTAVPDELYAALASNISQQIGRPSNESDISLMRAGVNPGGMPRSSDLSDLSPRDNRFGMEALLEEASDSGLLRMPSGMTQEWTDGVISPRGPEDDEHGQREASPVQGLLRQGAPQGVDATLQGEGSSGTLGFTVQNRGLTHEIVRAPSIPPLELGGVGAKPVTPGTDRVGAFAAWEQSPSMSGAAPDAAYSGYDLQPHQHIAALAAQRSTSPDASRPTTTNYAPSSGRMPHSEIPSPAPIELAPPPADPPTPRDVPSEQSTPRSTWPANTIHAINLKTDDQLYIVIGGEVALAAVLQPDLPDVAVTAVRAAQQAAVRYSAAARHHSAWVDPLAPVVLSTVHAGATFSAATALALAELQPPGAPLPLETPKAAALELAAAGTSATRVPAIPGTRQIMAVQQGEMPLEVLCMSRPLFSLSVTGGARTAKAEEVAACLRRTAWTAPLWEHLDPAVRSNSPRKSTAGWDGPTIVANQLQASCRVEEVKMGMELLRRAEPAPVIYFIMDGETVINAAHVGLADANPAGAPLHELTRLKGSGCCGELSLLASRPLWYSLMVSSATAHVLCMELSALREFVATHVMADGAAELLRAVAAVDLELYATAIHSQAQHLAAGELELGLFNAATRDLLLQVLDLGQLDQSDNHPAIKKAAAAVATTAAGEVPEGMAPVIIEGGGKADELVSDLARPTHLHPTVHEVASLRKTQANVRRNANFMSDLDNGSTITNLPSALPMALSAGPALLTQSMALYASQSMTDFTLGTIPGGNTTTTNTSSGVHHGSSSTLNPVLRITMPNQSTEENAYKRPAPVRPPKQFDLRPMPKALTGAEIEANRVPEDEVLPLSVLTAQEVLDMIQVKVHLKPAATTAVPQLVGTANGASSNSTASRPASAHPASGSSSVRVLNAGASGTGPRRPRRSSLAVTTSPPEADQQGTRRVEAYHCPSSPTPKEAAAWPLPSSPPRVAPAAARPIPASRAFKGAVYRASAATFKQRGRAVVRSLTADMWDDSQDALQRLLLRQSMAGDGSGCDSNRPSMAGREAMPPARFPSSGLGRERSGGNVDGVASSGHVSASATTRTTFTSEGTTSAAAQQALWPSLSAMAHPDSKVNHHDIMPEQATVEAEDTHAKPEEAMPQEGPAAKSGADSNSGSSSDPGVPPLPLPVTDEASPFVTTTQGKGVSMQVPPSDQHASPPPSGSTTSRSTTSKPEVAVPAYILRAIEADEQEQRRLAQLALTAHSPVAGRGVEDDDDDQAPPQRLAMTLTQAGRSIFHHSFKDTSSSMKHAGGSGLRGSASEEVEEEGSSAGEAATGTASEQSQQQRRQVWVRDGVYDPSGITNPLVAGLMTQAVATALPEGADLGAAVRVRLPAPVGGLPDPQMRDLPINGPWVPPPPPPPKPVAEVATPPSANAAKGLMGSNPATAASGQRRGGMLGGKLSGGSVAPSGANTARSQTGGSGLGSTGKVLGMSIAAAAGVLSPRSQQAAASASATPDVIPEAQATATSLRLQSMTPFSSSLLLRNRMRMRAAQLGQARPQHHHQTLGNEARGTHSAPGFGDDEEDEEGPRAVPPVMVEVDARTLAQQDLTYVTIEMPPAIKTTPDVQFATAIRPPPQLFTLPPAPQQGVHMKAMMTTVSLGEGLSGEDTMGKYVPTFLRSRRENVQPLNSKQTVANQQWVVPAFSSTMGFQSGLYDEDAEIMYFD